MENKKTVADSYNEVPYISKSFATTSPEHQASILKLLGVEGPDVEKASILEIGCSFGGNIIPFAASHPESEVIGIDISEIQVKEGNRIIELLGLKNVKLLNENILYSNENLGKFDYIICHGVFSWVTSEVQEAILKVIKNHLNDNGSAVISYNTYPGWKNMDIFRDIMNFKVNYSEEKNNTRYSPLESVALGKESISFLDKFSELNSHLKAVSDSIKNQKDYYLYHEYFESENVPLYLYNFNKLLEKYDLFHISDTNLQKSFSYFNNSELKEFLFKECGDNHILREQYSDYLSNQQFRSSLITHKKNKSKFRLDGNVSIDNLNSLHIMGSFQNVEKSLAEEPKRIMDDIMEIFPNSIKISDLYKKHSDIEKFYSYIVDFVYKNYAHVLTHSVKLKKNKVLKLNPIYRNYFEYASKIDTPLITMANFLGFTFELTQVEKIMLPYFDGKKSDKDIEKIILEKHKKNEFSISNLKEGFTVEKFVENFVKNLREFVERNFLNI